MPVLCETERHVHQPSMVVKADTSAENFGCGSGRFVQTAFLNDLTYVPVPGLEQFQSCVGYQYPRWTGGLMKQKVYSNYS